MAGNSLALTWDLIARDGASPVFERVSAAADKAAASTETAAVKTGASLSTMAKVGAAAGVAFAAVAVKMASDFQRQMLLVQTQAGASAAEVQKMTPAILSLAGKTAQAPEALATSLYHVESTGLRGAAALNAVQIAAEGAQVGHADLEETTNALTATIASGMLPATESYAQAMGQLNTIVGSGDMKLSDLNDALGTGVLVQVKQYGATINDVGAALADFGDNNIRGADAATMLRMAVQSIAKPGVGAADALGKIGLTVAQLQSDEQTGGLNKALTDLHSHLVSSGIASTEWGALMTDAFTKKAGGGITTLIGTFDRFEQKYKEVSAGAGSFGDAWEATTKTAAFQAAALKDNIEAMTISVGNHLLPVVTATMTWINQNGVPALENLGSGAEDVAHWFGDLPAPIRDTALALGGLALANAVGLTGALASGVGRVGSAFSGAGGAVAGFGDDMALQSHLAAMEASSLSDVDRALGAVSGSAARAAGSLTAAQAAMSTGKFSGWDVALSNVAAEEEAVASGTGRIGAAMSTLAVAGQRAGSGLLNALGGWTGIGIGAAIAGVSLLVSWLDKSNQATQEAAQYEKSLTDALEQSNGALDDNVRKLAAKQAGDDGLLLAAQKAGVSLPLVTDALLGNKNAYQQVSTALTEYANEHHGVTGVAAAAKAAYDDEGKAALAAKNNLGLLSGQQSKAEGDAQRLAAATQGSAAATTAAGDAAQAAAPKLEFAGNAAGMSKDQIDAANKSWETWIKNLSGIDQAFTDPLTTYENLLSQKQQAEQASAQATADATKSGKDSWQDYASSVSVSISEYAKQLEAQLKNEQDWQKNLVIIAQRGGFEVAQQFADMGQKGADITAQMATATSADFSRMETVMINQAAAGGQGAAAALDTKLRVMAEIAAEGGAATANAIAQALGVGINDVASIAAQYGVKLATGLEPILHGLGKPPIVVPGFVTRPGLIGRNADGGFISGPGDGRSDSILSFLSNGEFVVNADATSKNRPLLEALNDAPRFAGGGFVSASDVPHPYSTAPYGALVASPSDGTMSLEYNDVTSWLQSNLFTGGGGGAGSPAIRALGQQIAASMGYGGQFSAIDYIFSHESGWNPLAQNPTSTAFGIPQFLNSTWGAYGGKTTDPGRQITDGISYMRDRYGSPSGAAAFWQAHHWYKDGTNYVPSDQLAMLHKGEAVVPASQNQGAPYRDAPLTITGTLEIGGDGLARIIDGRIVSYSDAEYNRAAY